jgi:hypothetical protein
MKSSSIHQIPRPRVALSPPPVAFPRLPARLTALALSAVIFLSGCTTLTSVAPPKQGATLPEISVRVGDSIEARLKDGTLAAFKVTAIEPDSFVGAQQRIAFSQITELRVRHLSPGRTVGMVGIVFVGTLLVAFVVAAATGPIAIMPAE